MYKQIISLHQGNEKEKLSHVLDKVKDDQVRAPLSYPKGGRSNTPVFLTNVVSVYRDVFMCLC